MAANNLLRVAKLAVPSAILSFGTVYLHQKR